MFSPPLPMYLGIQECIKTRSIPNFFFNWGDGIVPYRLCGAKQQPSFSLTLSISQEKYNVSMLYWIIYLSLQLVVGIAGEKPNTTYQKKNKKQTKNQKKWTKIQMPTKKIPKLCCEGSRLGWVFLQNTAHPTLPPAFVSGCQRSVPSPGKFWHSLSSRPQQVSIPKKPWEKMKSW